MPIVLDGGTVDVALKSDQDKPIESRPVLICRYLTCKQVLDYEQAIAAASAIVGQVELNGALNSALKIIIIGFKNMGEAKTLDDVFDNILSPAEKWELAYSTLQAVQLSELDKKKLRSNSPSTGNSSAPDASTESAPTVPANNLP